MNIRDEKDPRKTAIKLFGEILRLNIETELKKVVSFFDNDASPTVETIKGFVDDLQAAETEGNYFMLINSYDGKKKSRVSSSSFGSLLPQLSATPAPAAVRGNWFGMEKKTAPQIISSPSSRHVSRSNSICEIASPPKARAVKAMSGNSDDFPKNSKIVVSDETDIKKVPPAPTDEEMKLLHQFTTLLTQRSTEVKTLICAYENDL